MCPRLQRGINGKLLTNSTFSNFSYLTRRVKKKDITYIHKYANIKLCIYCIVNINNASNSCYNLIIYNYAVGHISRTLEWSKCHISLINSRPYFEYDTCPLYFHPDLFTVEEIKIEETVTPASLYVIIDKYNISIVFNNIYYKYCFQVNQQIVLIYQ